MTELQTLDELLVHDMRDLHSAETLVRDSLPQLAATSTTAAVRSLIDGYYGVVKAHCAHLDQLFAGLRQSPAGKPCRAIGALVEADRVLIRQDADAIVMDAALLGAVSRMQHYKIAAYAACVLQAGALGRTTVAEALRRCLHDERDAARRLDEVSRTVVVAAPRE